MKVQSCLLKSYPDGPLSKENFSFTSTDATEDDLSLNNKNENSNTLDDVLVELQSISVDPYMLTRFKPEASPIMPCFQINQPIESRCVAKVLESNHPDLVTGDLVVGVLMPWRTRSVVKRESLQKLEVGLEHIPSRYYLGLLGSPGLAAYMPFVHFAKSHLHKDSIVFVSGAAGSVGSVFGQLCKQLVGCTVYGSAGSAEKIDLLRTRLGFDNAFNYKNGIASGLDQMLQSSPGEQKRNSNETDPYFGEQKRNSNKIDLYFDNVGGEMLDQVLSRMNINGHIICCGSISQYNNSTSDNASNVSHENYGIKNTFYIVTNQLTLHGFVVGQWANEFGQAKQELIKLVQEGRLQVQETVLKGFDKVVDGLLGLLDGTNMGKMIISLEE